MTDAMAAATEGVIRPSQSPRTAHTLRLRQLVEEQQRLEIAERIRELREQSRFTQPLIAEKLGLTLRGYQKLEERGTTKWERAEALASIFDVDPFYIWDGRERGQTPDLMATLSDNGTAELKAQLDRIEAKLDRLLEVTEPLPSVVEEAEQAADAALQESAPPRAPSSETLGKRKREAQGR